MQASFTEKIDQGYPNKVQTATGTYDLAELRKKLEQRIEYSKVATLPHDPTMDPAETVPSYASSTAGMSMSREEHLRHV